MYSVQTVGWMALSSQPEISVEALMGLCLVYKVFASRYTPTQATTVGNVG